MAPPKKRGAGTNIDHDDIASFIAENLNKNEIDTFFLDEESPTDLKDFISTGSSLLDLIISNRPHGGIACGRITELNGLEGAGKSLIAAHLCASVQKEGGIAAYIDTETAQNTDFLTAIGVQLSGPNRLVYIHAQTVEQIFDAVVKILEVVKQKDPERKRKVVVIVDSISNAPPAKELEADFSKDGYATEKAIIISKAMRKVTQLIARERVALVFVQQLRFKMNAQPFADPYTTSGGKGIPYASSTRIRLAQKGKIKVGDAVVGVKVIAKTDKNRLGPPHRSCEFDVYFDRGIDDISSWLDFLKNHDIVEGTNGRFRYIDSNGEEHKFMRGDWTDFAAKHPEVVEEIYQKMCETVIMKYKSEDINTLDGSAEVITGGDDE